MAIIVSRIVSGPPLAERAGELARAGDYLRSCTLTITQRHVPLMHVFNPAQCSGEFEAEIVNCSTDPMDLLNGPSVFEWPDGRAYIKMQVTRIERERQRAAAECATVTRVWAIVLNIVQYGPRRIEEAEARRQLALPEPSTR